MNIDLQLDNDDNDNGFIIVSNNEFKANYALYLWRQLKSVVNKRNLTLCAILVLFFLLNNLLLFRIVTYDNKLDKHSHHREDIRSCSAIDENDYREALNVIGKQKNKLLLMLLLL